MTILNVKTQAVGEAGIIPRTVRIETDDSVAAVTTTGYLDDRIRQGETFFSSDYILVTTQESVTAQPLTNAYQFVNNTLELLGEGIQGPGSSTDNAIPRFNGSTGQILKNSGVILDDSDVMTGVTDFTVDNINIDGNAVNATSGDLNLTSTSGEVNVPTPTSPTNAVTKAYVDALPTGGDVVGPASSTDESLPRYDGVTGKLLQGSPINVSDAGAMTGVSQIIVDNIDIDGNSVNATTGDLNLSSTSGGVNVPTPTLPTQAVTKAYADALPQGDVVGPLGATDNALVRMDGVTGKLVKNSVGILTDAGELTGLANFTVDNVNINGNDINANSGDLNLTATAGQVNVPTPVNPTNAVTKAYVDALPTGGDVTGPGSSTDNAIARMDGLTGKIIQNSIGILTDTGELTGLTNFTVDNININGNTINATSGVLNLTAAGNEVNVPTPVNPTNATTKAYVDALPTGGDVTGPGSSTDNAIARMDGITGKIIQNSIGILTDTGELTGLTNLTVDNVNINGNTVNAPTGDLNLASTSGGVNVPTPTLAAHATTKAYVDALAGGGKVLQFIPLVSTGADITTTSTALTSTGISNNITISSVGNYIVALCFFSANCRQSAIQPASIQRVGEFDLIDTVGSSNLTGRCFMGRTLDFASANQNQSYDSPCLVGVLQPPDTILRNIQLRFANTFSNTDLIISRSTSNVTLILLEVAP